MDTAASRNATAAPGAGVGGGLAGLLPEVQTLELLVAVSIFVAIHSLRQRRAQGLPSWPLVGMLPSLLLGLRGDMYEWITGVLRARGGYTLLLPATMLGVLDVRSAARAAAWPPGQSVWMMSVWTIS